MLTYRLALRNDHLGLKSVSSLILVVAVLILFPARANPQTAAPK